LREIQKRIIPPGSALIEYMVSEAQTLAFVVGPDTLVSLALDLGETELRAMVDALLEDARIVGAGKIRNFAEIRFDLATAHRLYNKLVAPLERHIPIGNALIIIPDGVLHYLPFEALVAGIREGPLLPPAPLPWYKRLFAKSTMRHAPLFQEYESAYFLAEKFAISYASSASVLDSEILLSQKRHVPSENLAIFASPDFSRASQTQLASLRAAPIFNFASLILMGPDNVWEFSPLLQTENYARQMARQVRPSNLFVGAAATEESFKREAGNYRYVHIATHTATEERMPMYSRIIFAQDDDPAEDGFLHTHEILNLRLSAELVTLVGCRTGLGRLQRGEGLVGLTRAFIYAGAPSVVVSLWAVEESSGLLMKYFYANLEQGMSKAEALRQAKLRMIKSRGKLPDGKEISYAHPFLWAPFVLVGENR
jgi:CHAT domain-containing protein